MEASSLWGPHSLPHGEAPGMVERPGSLSMSAPHPQENCRVGAPPPRGEVANIEPCNCQEGEKESKADFHRKQHFLFV